MAKHRENVIVSVPCSVVLPTKPKDETWEL